MIVINFDERGYLAGREIVAVTFQDIEQVFTRTAHRFAIWQQFCDLRHWLIEQQIPVITIWLDGSFISANPSPNDLDLIIYLPTAYLTGEFSRLEKQCERHKHLDVFWVGLYQGDSVTANALNQLEKFRWYSLFTEVKGNGYKSFVELTD
jgi:hypothetical protein